MRKILDRVKKIINGDIREFRYALKNPHTYHIKDGSTWKTLDSETKKKMLHLRNMVRSGEIK